MEHSSELTPEQKQQADIQEAAAWYRETVQVEQIAMRQRREATEVLLWALGVSARNSTLISTTERPTSWPAHLDDYRKRVPLPPRERRMLRALRKNKDLSN